MLCSKGTAVAANQVEAALVADGTSGDQAGIIQKGPQLLMGPAAPGGVPNLGGLGIHQH